MSVVNNGGNWGDALHSVLPSRKLEGTPTPGGPRLLQTTIGADTSKDTTGIPPVTEVTGETPGTGDTPGKGETSETGDTPGTGEKPGTGETPGTRDNLETGEKQGTGETPGTGDPLGHRYTAGVRIYSPDQSLMKEGVPVASDDEDDMMAFVGFS